MTDTELWDAIDGLFAYDSGAIDSGIKDESLRKHVIDELKTDAESDYPRLTRFLHEFYTVSPYTIGDVSEFLRWLEDEMEVSL